MRHLSHRLSITILVAALLGACGDADRTVSKPELVDGKADTSVNAKLCAELGQAGDCDVCALAGWLGDGECDTFCQTLDPDCTLPADAVAALKRHLEQLPTSYVGSTAAGEGCGASLQLSESGSVLARLVVGP